MNHKELTTYRVMGYVNDCAYLNDSTAAWSRCLLLLAGWVSPLHIKADHSMHRPELQLLGSKHVTHVYALHHAQSPRSLTKRHHWNTQEACT